MRIRMTVAISGTRNGKDWPVVGGLIDLPTGEAEQLLAAGLAAPAAEEPAEETATAPAAAEETATPRRTPPTRKTSARK